MSNLEGKKNLVHECKIKTNFNKYRFIIFNSSASSSKQKYSLNRTNPIENAFTHLEMYITCNIKIRTEVNVHIVIPVFIFSFK